MPRPIIVFDLDGTLVDTAPDLVDTLNVILQSENIPAVAYDDARAMIGDGMRPMIERALEEQKRNLDADAVDALFARFIAHYQDHIADRSRTFAGVEAALDLLARDFVLAVCTNKFEGLSVRLLDALGLSSRFAAICGQDTFQMKKPDRGALLGTISRAQGDASRAVMVGDSETDIRLARAAGIPVIGVDFGYTRIPMAALAPDRVIGHFELLPQAVSELLPASSRKASGQIYG